MMHDFSLTSGHVVFLDLPVVFAPSLDASGRMPYRWDETYRSGVGVLRCDDPFGEVRWLDVSPCFVFHTLNAYDDTPVVPAGCSAMSMTRPRTPVIW